MAEFQEVGKQWKRMCKEYWSVSKCSGCPIAEHEQTYEACIEPNLDISKMEECVMSWAAEHPEPVYPTWGDYLISKGLLMPYWNERGTAPYDMYIYAERALANHIPADIAQKLGIEPKEG